MKKYNILFILLAVVSIAISITTFFMKPKIGYVKSSDLIYGYLGMKEAQQKQSLKTVEFRSELDSLRLDFQNNINQYNLDFKQLSDEEKVQREKLLSMQEKNLKNYAQSIDHAISEQDEQLTQGVLNQINAFVEEYAKRNNFDMVLGTTTSGNIMYAKDYMDITKGVLDELNSNYKPELK